ncbi:MAG: helix-turn-helix transcriptional regulator [Kiritimatiellae bacterium]|nr:helix-turn-helix transcriptional regulator [Kiritimatiellia bacterium]
MNKIQSREGPALLNRPCPVERITGIWKFTRRQSGYSRTHSLPGHLLHLVLSGAYRMRTNGREYAIKTGDVIYYHETEEVEWLGNAKPVSFYSIGFLAPSMAPLPMETRVFHSTRRIRKAFDRVYAASLQPPGQSTAAAYAALLQLLLEIEPWRGRPATSSADDTPWRRCERAVRERHTFRPSVGELCVVAHRSRASLVRDCRNASGLSPMQRMRAIRMEEARGLLRFSVLSVSQIAEYLGYPRLHEFSREFSRYFGHPPSTVRAQRAGN